MTNPTTTKFQIGQRVIDGDGFAGTITGIGRHDGAHWYEVRLKSGTVVRYDSDLTAAA